MTWEKFNNNPTGRSVGDCTVRAISKALGVSWEQAYAMIAANGFAMGDMPTSSSASLWDVPRACFYFSENQLTARKCYNVTLLHAKHICL